MWIKPYWPASDTNGSSESGSTKGVENARAVGDSASCRRWRHKPGRMVFAGNDPTSSREWRLTALVLCWSVGNDRKNYVLLNQTGTYVINEQHGDTVLRRLMDHSSWDRSRDRKRCCIFPQSTPFSSLNCGPLSRRILINHSLPPPPHFFFFVSKGNLWNGNLFCCFHRHTWRRYTAVVVRVWFTCI